MRLFTLALIPSALAVTVFKCVPFEEPTSNNVYLNISNKEVDSSVLIYNVKDIIGTNIPSQLVSEELLEVRNDDFGICTEELKSQDVCDTVGEYVIKYKKGITKNENIYNSLVKAGKEYTYQIKTRGLYCIIGHQEGNSLNGLTVEPHHSYGQLDYPDYISYHTTLAALVLEIILLAVSKTLSVKDESVPHSVIKNFLSASIFAHLLKSVSSAILNAHNESGIRWSANFMNEILDVLKSIIIWAVLFGASLNKAVLYNNFEKDFKLIKSNNRFKLLFAGYIAVSLVQTLRIPLPSIASTIISIASAFIWIPMFSIINKNYKATADELNFDNMRDYARNYKLSKKSMLAIPIILTILPSFYIFATAFATASENSNPTMNQLDVFNNAFATSLDGTFSYGTLMILNIPTYTIALISLVLLVIWKPYNKSSQLQDTVVYDVDTSAKSEKV